MKKMYIVALIASCIGLIFSCEKSSTTDNTNTNPCSGVTVSVTISAQTNPTTGQSNGSFTVSASPTGSYTYSIDGTNFQSSPSFSNLAAGTYTITAKSSAGCTGTTQGTLTAVAPNPCQGITISVTTSAPTQPTAECGGTTTGSFTASASGGSGTYTYTLNPGGITNTTGTFSGLSVGSYTVTASTTAGCTSNPTSVTIAYPTISFNTDIQPVFSQICGSCHSNYTTYSGINGNYLAIMKRLRGNSDNIISCVTNGSTTTGGAYNMPQSGSLPVNWTIQKYNQWVKQGHLNN